MQFSLRALLIAVPLLTLMLGAAISIWRGFQYGIDDAYAEWGAAALVIRYMEEHDGAWPKHWEALRADYEDHGGRVGGWSFEKFRSRVYIDFTADPEELRRQSLSSESPAFRVISATHNTGVHWDRGPNQILHNYFRATASNASE